MGAPRIQTWSSKSSRKRKLEKVTNIKLQNVEILKIMKNEMRGLKSGNVEISSILQQKSITHKKIETN